MDHVMLKRVIVYLAFQEQIVMQNYVVITFAIVVVYVLLWMELTCVAVNLDSWVKYVIRVSYQRTCTMQALSGVLPGDLAQPPSHDRHPGANLPGVKLQHGSTTSAVNIQGIESGSFGGTLWRLMLGSIPLGARQLGCQAFPRSSIPTSEPPQDALTQVRLALKYRSQRILCILQSLELLFFLSRWTAITKAFSKLQLQGGGTPQQKLPALLLKCFYLPTNYNGTCQDSYRPIVSYRPIAQFLPSGSIDLDFPGPTCGHLWVHSHNL